MTSKETTEEKTSEKEETKDSPSQIYELAYLLLPTITEEALNEAVDSFVSKIQKEGGSQISNQTPSMMEIAYPIRKEIDRKYHAFNSAYFGWIKFELSPASLEKINDFCKESGSVLRHLIVKSSKAAPAPKPRQARKPKTETSDSSSDDKKEEKDDSSNDEAIDKEIDALIASTEEEKVVS